MLSIEIEIESGGGVTFTKIVDVPVGLRKSDFLYRPTNFLPNFPPSSRPIPFSKEKHPILIKLGAFYNNLPKIHLIYVIWATSSLMKTAENPLITIKFREKTGAKKRS